MVVPSQAVYLYLYSTVPLQVGPVAGVLLTNTALTVLPQASNILAGAPGSVTCAGQDTVDDPFDGAVKPPLYVIVYV